MSSHRVGRAILLRQNNIVLGETLPEYDTHRRRHDSAALHHDPNSLSINDLPMPPAAGHRRPAPGVHSLALA